MNEDEVVEGCIPSTEETFSRNNSKDNIPDAKYYLIRPEDSKTVYIMKEKPDYNRGPFYKACEKNMSYLNAYCVGLFGVPSLWDKGCNILFVIGLVPEENSITYIFDKPKENEIDLNKALAYTDSYKTDNEVADHYKLYDWHISILLNNEPFKSYIQEHLDEFKVEKSEALPVPNPTKESKSASVILNKRLLI